MALTWAQRREELLGDCIVSPDVFNPMIDRLAAFVVPYQQALETEAAQRNLYLYLQGLLSHLPRKMPRTSPLSSILSDRSCKYSSALRHGIIVR
jgi:hypothetical protein